MKRFLSILAALALIVLMQGCGKGVEPETPDNPVQLHLKGNISAIAPSTRVNADGFESNDKVGVYVSPTTSLAKSGNTLDNEAFSYSSGNLIAPEGKEVYWNRHDTKLSVWAYYPYATSISDNTAHPFAVNTDQSEAEDYYNSDFITAQATNLAPRAEAVDLTFNHSLSKIIVTLKAGEGITTEELASATKSISISGAIVDGTIDLADGTATVGTTKETVSLYALNNLNYVAIVYPQQSEISFRIELGDEVYTYSTEVDYVAGTQHKYTFTLDTHSPRCMTLASTTISDWAYDENPTEETISNIITFADPKFKTYLLNEVIYKESEGQYVATDKKIDANNDEEISIAEAEKVEYINANNLGITNINELHYFPNLKFLSCAGNKLTSLDISKNTTLTTLKCFINKLTTLDVSNNIALKKLECSNNQLTSLDISNNIALEYLNCWNNQLTSLDVSNNLALNMLFFSDNQLTALDISKNTALRGLSCANNQLATLNVSKNTALEDLYCLNNQLTTLDVSKNTALEELQCEGNQLTSLDISKNTALEYLVCYENKLTTLDISKNTVLEYLECYGNQLTSLDVSNNPALSTLFCNPMNDASGNNLLTKLYLATGQSVGNIDKPEATEIEYKQN